MMEIYTVLVDGDSGGFVTFALETYDDHPMHLAFFDETFGTGSLLDATRSRQRKTLATWREYPSMYQWENIVRWWSGGTRLELRVCLTTTT